MYKKAFELSYKNKKVEIEIQDFTGTVRNINGTEDLFSLSYISDSKDKGQSILVTEADINFYADDYFNIDELKTVGETDIKVKYYEDDALLWSGFVIPDFFSTSVDIAPVVSMVATDRVGTLKEISNNAESNIPIQILASCLKQTGQDLPINLIADNNRFETPIQLERIEDIASYDVIRTFMVLFNCKITLYKNAWWIINKKLLESGFVNYKSYNSDGAGGSITSFAQPILNIDLVDRDGQREIKPTASEISLFLEFGGSKKYPKNWNFEKWIINPQATSTALFNDWELKGVFYPYPFTDLLPIANNNQITGYEVSGNSLVATKDTSINYDSYNLQLRTSTQQGSGTDQSKMSYRHLESSYSKVVFLDGKTEIKVSINFTNPSGEFINVTPVIRTKNSNGTLKRYFAIDNDKSVKKAGEASINLFGVEPIRVEATQSETKIAVQTKWENIFITDDSTLELAEGDTADVMLIIWGVRFYPLGAPNIKSYIDTFIHSANISFNDYEVTGKGLIFKTKQGGEKFSKSRETETILFSDKINQGVNGYFYNYKYDDTSIVDLPSEFALSSVRERADMFSKARDYYSLDGDFIVNPLAKYVCGLKSFVLIGGQNRREDASIIVEEIVSNTLNRTDFIYTYFDDGKDKVKTIGTASGGSSSSGGGGSSPSTPQLIKEDEEGNYYSEQPFYSLGGLSAFGFSEVGDGNGGGGIINVIDNLTSTSKTDPLSANQGRYLKTLIDNIEVGEGGQVIVDWEAITGKPSTFAPSAHTHIIGNVTGLQSALDGKASLSQLDDKEDKFTKNTAFNKNFGTGLNDVARGNHTHAFASLTSIPTTLAGYGITDGANKVHTHAISDVTGLQTSLDSKLNKLTFDDLFEKVETSAGKWAVKVKYNLFSVGEISAFGAGESEGGGGGSMNMMQGWTIPTGTENYYLPAKLAVPFYNDTRDRLSTLEAGTAPASHTHPISDVTNLQTALNSKLETSVFNTHNNDNVRHITSTERTKWDTVVTDFDELEIGSRNYILHSLMMGGTNPTFGDDDRGRWYNISHGVQDTTLRGVFKENTQYTLWYERGEIDSGGIRVIIRYTDGTNSGYSLTTVPFTTPKNKTVSYVYITYATAGRLEIINPTFVEGNKPMKSWTPAPEDQVSDWLTTDVNSFSFIKNKPTLLSQFTDNIGVATHIANKANPHSVTKAQVGLSNVDNAKQATKVEFDLFKSAYDEMFRKVGTSIEAKLPLYSLGGLSAYGFSDEGSGGGGGIVNILPSWANYTTDKSGWALSAGLGVDLNNRKADKTWVESLLEDYVPTDTTYTAGRGLILTGTQFSTSFDIANYATVTALGGKVDKKTGYSLVSDTEISRLANVTNQDISGKADKATSLSGYGITDAYTKTNVNDLLSNKADKATKITAGTGLTGGGTLASDRTLSVNFGTTAGTVTQGNDSRLSDARTPLAHSHAIADVTGLQTSLDSKLNKLTFDDLFEKVETSAGKWAVKVKYNLFSVGEISAFGAGESEGGGGGSMNMMQTWSTSVETENYYLPAKLAAPFYDDTRSRLSTLEAGTAPASHTHPISDITDLQTTLNNKLETSIFNTHNTDNIRHITGAERTKWDDAIGDFSTHIANNSNPHSVTKGQVGLSNVDNTADVNKNVLSATKLIQINSFDANDVVGGASFNYSSGDYWINAPTGMNYGGIGNVISRGTNSLSLQLAFDINHNSELSTKDLWFRSANNLGFQNDWKKVWHSGNLTSLSQLTDNIGVATHIANKTNPHSVTKAQVGLGNVDNTSDLLKPVSNATQTALALKLNKLTFDDLFEKVETSTGKWAVKVKYNLFSVGEISAFGFEEESGGSGGGSMSMMQGWTFTTATENYYLPAKLAVPFYDDTRSRLTTLEGGSATTVNTSGTGDLLASVSKVGNNINFIKGNQSWGNLSGKPSVFAPSAHTHPISDITNLQTTLNSKLETSIFNTHNNDNIRHITGAERTKWDTVVTDFGNLEIGGRNLISLIDLEANHFTNAENTGLWSWKYAGEPNTKYTLSTDVPKNGSTYDVFFGTPPLSASSGVNGVAVNEPRTVISDENGEVEVSFRKGGVDYITMQQILDKEYWVQLEKGTKATDWTPAPEDQVSDWLTTDVNSFSFIKNKPTLLSQFTDNIGVATHIANKTNPHSVTKAQVGLGNVLNVASYSKIESDNKYLPFTGGTLTGNVTAPTFIGALSGNATTATTLQTPRTLWGQSFDGSENVSGAMTGITTLAMTGALTGATILNASQNVNTPKVSFGNGWTAEGVGVELQFKLNGVIQAKIVNGALVSMGEVTAYE